MYKRAARGTGGSSYNGRAKYARRPGNVRIERAASQTAMARRIVLSFGPVLSGTVSKLTDYDVSLLICKIIDEGLTIDKQLMALYPALQRRLERDGSKISLYQGDRLLADKALVAVIARWSRYRGMSD